ncbi:MAG: capsular exopolysaccharide synthesis family protein [Sediminicola sp.]|jgi:capsular exopolysaccharide synthesis family protein|tara:strand:- start:1021 stop:3408 length:2388 start_codon:yes stop_codon:yes gene_type:complete
MTEKQAPYDKPESEYAADILELIKRYLRQWPWFVLSILICLIASNLYLRYTPKVYSTSAKILILEEGNGLNLDMEGVLLNKSRVNLANEIEILTSYRMMEKVEEELDLSSVFSVQGDIKIAHLDTLPFSYKQIRGDDMLSNGRSFVVTVTPTAFEVYNIYTDSTTLIANHDTYLIHHNLPFQIKIESPEQLSESLGGQYNISLRSKQASIMALKRALKAQPGENYSEILKLTIQGQNTSRSEKTLNVIIRTFNEDGMADRQLVSKRTLEFIDERFIFLSKELDSIELGKKEFKQENNLFTMESDAANSLQSEIIADDEVFRLENQLALSELLDEAMNTSNNKSKLLPANFGLESAAINGLIDSYNTAILNSEKLISNGGINNPLVRQSKLQLVDLRNNINNSLRAFQDQLKLSQKQLTSRDKKFKSEVYNLPQKEKLLRAIERQQTIKESLFLLLLQKREEASISLAVTEPSIKVVEFPISNGAPVSPKPKAAYVGALMVGFIVPFGVFFVVFLLDVKIHGKNDIERLKSDIPIVGEIPKINEGSKAVFSNPNDRSVLAESFRIFSSNVKYILPIKEDGKGSVICVTSTIKGEGKTFISLNLSLAFSSLNKKVLLIGSDLRNPQLHSYIDVDKNQSGLSNYLHDKDNDWKDSLIGEFKDHSSHDILISGVIPPNPPNLLTNGRLDALLEEARTLYDFIILDTAPTIAVTDTLLISNLADATVYVVRANFTEKDLLGYSIGLAKNRKLNNMAYVINQVGANGGSKYGYKYGYNYGYGYGYSDEVAKTSRIKKIFKR